MSKFLSTDWKVMVNGTDLSRFADSVDAPEEKEQVDVSGFGGTREFLPGIKDSTITVEFIQGFGTNEPHQVLYPLFSSGTTFVVYVQPFRSLGTSATNPVFGGTASVYNYNGASASLNDAAKFTQDFKPAPGAVWVWGTVAP